MAKPEPISTFASGESIDFQVLTELGNNDMALLEMMPYVMAKGGGNPKRKSENNHSFQIISGISDLKDIHGKTTDTIDFGNTDNGPGIPVVIPVFFHAKGANVRVVVSKVTNSKFTVVLYPASSKSKIKGSKLLWIAIHER